MERWSATARTGILPSVVTAPLSAAARNKHELYRTVASVSSKALLIDSSKHYRAAPQRTKILLLVRDGRAVFYSSLKRGKPRQAALNSWLRSYSRALPLLESQIGPRDILRVSYEGLAGNDMRLAGGSMIRADTAWRDRLTPNDLDYFERRAGDFNRALGYA